MNQTKDKKKLVNFQAPSESLGHNQPLSDQSISISSGQDFQPRSSSIIVNDLDKTNKDSQKLGSFQRRGSFLNANVKNAPVIKFVQSEDEQINDSSPQDSEYSVVQKRTASPGTLIQSGTNQLFGIDTAKMDGVNTCKNQDNIISARNSRKQKFDQEFGDQSDNSRNCSKKIIYHRRKVHRKTIVHNSKLKLTSPLQTFTDQANKAFKRIDSDWEGNDVGILRGQRRFNSQNKITVKAKQFTHLQDPQMSDTNWNTEFKLYYEASEAFFQPKYKKIQSRLLKQTEKMLRYKEKGFLENPNKPVKCKTDPIRALLNKDEESCGHDSQSTISSVDENDLEILMSGGHKIFFDAFFMMKEFFEVKEKEKINQKKEQKILNLKKYLDKIKLPCKKTKNFDMEDAEVQHNVMENLIKILQKKPTQGQDQTAQQPKQEVESKTQIKLFSSLNMIIDKKKSVKSHEESVEQPILRPEGSPQDPGLTAEMTNNDISTLQLNLRKKNILNVLNLHMIKQATKPKRTGKELWKIAHKLVMKNIKKDRDIASNFLKSVKVKKQLELEEAIKKKQMQIQQQKLIKAAQKTTAFQRLEKRFLQVYRRFLIDPRNKKLKYFHLIVAITLFFDFIITGLIMSNYLYMSGQQKNYLDQKSKYFFICIIQILDIFLNFFKMQETSNKQDQDPKQLAISYLKRNFITDVIAVIPYSIINRTYLFLRYLKLLKYSIYLKYVEEFLEVLFNSFMDSSQINNYMNLFRIFFQLIIFSHFFASMWSYLGQWLYYTKQGGWLTNAYQSGTQQLDQASIYTTSIYFVVTTFTSVGYGDICGGSPIEYLYQIIVMMFGICFFGYMTGVFQNIISSIGISDPLSEELEQLDLWLMKLDRSKRDQRLSSELYESIRQFHDQYIRRNVMNIQRTDIFKLLKPRLQRVILDLVFKQYYKLFEIVFTDCELGFIRQMIAQSRYDFIYCSEQLDLINESTVWPSFDIKPQIITQGHMSDNVYFLISGIVSITDKSGLYEYGLIHKGGYFGDISILLDEPNEYSYCFNPFQDKPIQMLAISASQFLQVCKKFPCSHDILLDRAREKKDLQQSYKIVTLIGFMKQLQKFPAFMRRRLLDGKTIPQRIETIKSVDIRLDLYKCLVHQFRLARIFSITWNLEQMLSKYYNFEDPFKEKIQSVLQAQISGIIGNQKRKNSQNPTVGNHINKQRFMIPFNNDKGVDLHEISSRQSTDKQRSGSEMEHNREQNILVKMREELKSKLKVIEQEDNEDDLQNIQNQIGKQIKLKMEGKDHEVEYDENGMEITPKIQEPDKAPLNFGVYLTWYKKAKMKTQNYEKEKVNDFIKQQKDANNSQKSGFITQNTLLNKSKHSQIQQFMPQALRSKQTSLQNSRGEKCSRQHFHQSPTLSSSLKNKPNLGRITLSVSSKKKKPQQQTMVQSYKLKLKTEGLIQAKPKGPGIGIIGNKLNPKANTRSNSPAQDYGFGIQNLQSNKSSIIQKNNRFPKTKGKAQLTSKRSSQKSLKNKQNNKSNDYQANQKPQKNAQVQRRGRSKNSNNSTEMKDSDLNSGNYLGSVFLGRSSSIASENQLDDQKNKHTNQIIEDDEPIVISRAKEKKMNSDMIDVNPFINQIQTLNQGQSEPSLDFEGGKGQQMMSQNMRKSGMNFQLQMQASNKLHLNNQLSSSSSNSDCSQENNCCSSNSSSFQTSSYGSQCRDSQPTSKKKHSRGTSSQCTTELGSKNLKTSASIGVNKCIIKNQKEISNCLQQFMDDRKRLMEETQQKQLLLQKQQEEARAKKIQRREHKIQKKKLKKEQLMGLNHTNELSADSLKLSSCFSEDKHFDDQNSSHSHDHASQNSSEQNHGCSAISNQMSSEIGKHGECSHKWNHFHKDQVIEPALVHNLSCQKHIDLILEEYLNIHMLDFQYQRGMSAEEHFEELKDLIFRHRTEQDGQTKQMKYGTTVAKTSQFNPGQSSPLYPITDVIQDVATKKNIPIDQVTRKMVTEYRKLVEEEEKDILNLMNADEMKRVEFLDHSAEQILVKSTKLVQQETCAQLCQDFKTNRLFEDVYFAETQNLVKLIAEMKENVKEKFGIICAKQKRLIIANQVKCQTRQYMKSYFSRRKVLNKFPSRMHRSSVNVIKSNQSMQQQVETNQVSQLNI